MLLLKRLLTFFVLFVILWVGLSFGALIVAGGIVGAQAARQAGATDYQSGYTAGHDAGREWGRRYGPVIILGALVISVVGSAAFSFSGVLPWCRAPRALPPVRMCIDRIPHAASVPAN